MSSLRDYLTVPQSDKMIALNWGISSVTWTNYMATEVLPIKLIITDQPEKYRDSVCASIAVSWKETIVAPIVTPVFSPLVAPSVTPGVTPLVVPSVASTMRQQAPLITRTGADVPLPPITSTMAKLPRNSRAQLMNTFSATGVNSPGQPIAPKFPFGWRLQDLILRMNSNEEQNFVLDFADVIQLLDFLTIFRFSYGIGTTVNATPPNLIVVLSFGFTAQQLQLIDQVHLIPQKVVAIEPAPIEFHLHNIVALMAPTQKEAYLKLAAEINSRTRGSIGSPFLRQLPEELRLQGSELSNFAYPPLIPANPNYPITDEIFRGGNFNGSVGWVDLTILKSLATYSPKFEHLLLNLSYASGAEPLGRSYIGGRCIIVSEFYDKYGLLMVKSLLALYLPGVNVIDLGATRGVGSPGINVINLGTAGELDPGSGELDEMEIGFEESEFAELAQMEPTKTGSNSARSDSANLFGSAKDAIILLPANMVALIPSSLVNINAIFFLEGMPTAIIEQMMKLITTENHLSVALFFLRSRTAINASGVDDAIFAQFEARYLEQREGFRDFKREAARVALDQVTGKMYII